MLLRKMHDIVDLVEWENEDLWQIFDEVIAKEVFDFNNHAWLVEMARLGYEIELPYKSFWASLVNVALLKHQEFDFMDDQTNRFESTDNTG